MPYFDGFLAAVPSANRATYGDFARKVAPYFREFGATRVVDALGDDVPRGEVTDFYRAVAAADDEIVAFGWMEYADKAARDAAVERMMNDPKMAEAGEMPFDGKRMVFGGFEPVVDEGPGGKAGYVEGFCAAVPTENRDRFIAHATKAAPLFLKHGALRCLEGWGHEVPRGEVTDFYRAVDAKDDETVIFSWIEWPDKATRDQGLAEVFKEMETNMADNPMPFDGKRMIFGGFEMISDA